MTIEFNCRYCDAIIRVPDSARGGAGRCPKCSNRITVPRKSTIKAPEVAPSPPAAEPAAASATEFVLPGVTNETVIYQPPTQQPPTSPNDDVVTLEVAQAESSVEVPPAKMDQIPVAPPAKAVAKPSAARRKPSHRSANPLPIIAAIIAISVLAVMGFLLYPQLVPLRLEGELVAGTSEELSLPGVVIDKSRSRLPTEELSSLLKKLERNPLPMTSNTMHVQVSGTDQGLKVSVEAGMQSQFYRVNPTRNDAIQKYLSEHAAELDAIRTQDTDRAFNEFFETYEKVLAKQAPQDSITAFRDSLALPALTGSLGYQAVAAYGRNLYRCAYEDNEGGLYFLLPAGVESFELIGREDNSGRTRIPMRYEVKVRGEIKLPEVLKTQSQPKPKSKPAPDTEKTSEMEDESKNGEK